MYHLTPKGIVKKTKLTTKYLDKMSKEYEELKNEIEISNNKKSTQKEKKD